jgi:hypothetical protein
MNQQIFQLLLLPPTKLKVGPTFHHLLQFFNFGNNSLVGRHFTPKLHFTKCSTFITHSIIDAM